MTSLTPMVAARPVIKNLPAFPPVALRLMNLLAKDDVSMRTVADLLKTDAGLAAEVLRLANSPLAGARFGASTLIHALSILGTRRIGGLVMTLTMSSLLRRLGKLEITRRCWRHNLATGLAAMELASGLGVDPEEAYMGGLLHDIGRLALIVTDTAAYAEILNAEGPVLALERDRFGIDHCAAGEMLVRHWRLPEVYLDVTRNHHAPDEDSSPLTVVIHVACSVADQIGFWVDYKADRGTEPQIDPHIASKIITTIDALESEYRM